MATAKGEVTLRGRFPAGTKVGLFRRVGDGGPAGDPVKTAKVSKDSVLRFDGLEHLSQWFAVAEIDGERRVVNVTAKDPAEVADRGLAATRHETAREIRAQAAAGAAQHRAAVEDDPLAASPALGGPDTTRQIVEGARSTESGVRLRNAAGQESRFASESAGVPTPEDQRPPGPHRRPRQEDVPDSVPQRSATLTGEATPIDPDQLEKPAKKRPAKKKAAKRKASKKKRGR